MVKGVSGLRSILSDVSIAIDKAIDATSGSKKVKLLEDKKIISNFKKNADRFGGRETRRRDATDKVSGKELPGATRVTKSTGEVTAIVGPARLKKLAKDIVAGKMDDRRSAIKKGLAAVGVTGVASFTAGKVTSNNKTKKTKAKTPPKPRAKPTPPPPKPKANPRTKNRKASKRYNIKT